MTDVNMNYRRMLLDLGVGGFNATAIVPYMMISPQTTDPKASQIILIVQHLQRRLFALGATDVPDSGRLDQPTQAALTVIAGDDWPLKPWAASVAAVLRAQGMGIRLSPATRTQDIGMEGPVPIAVGGPLDFLPDVPGGILTYAIAGYLLYRHFSKRAR